MNKKLIWIVGFMVVAAISCWATASSFHLMMPGMPIVAVWAMTIVFFILASYAVKMIFDALNNDGSLSHPKAMLWGGLALLIFTWIIISLPTNAHTFFYRLKIGDVATDDLKATKVYSQQLKDKSVTDSAYFKIEEEVLKEWSEFEREVNAGVSGAGLGKYAEGHISKINELLGAEYMMPAPAHLYKAGNVAYTQVINLWKSNYLTPNLAKLKRDKYQVSDEAVREASKDVARIMAMEDSIHHYILDTRIATSEAEPLIKETEGVLIVAYTNIKSNNQYVAFQNDDDKEQYTAEPLETKTTRFLNPYSVAYDYFSGKIPFTFTFWLLLSILIDVAGFFFFDMAFKKEYNF